MAAHPTLILLLPLLVTSTFATAQQVDTARATTMTRQRDRSPATTTTAAPTPTRAGIAPRAEGRSIAPSAPAATIVSATGFKGVAGPKSSQLSWNSAPGAVGYGLTRYDPTTQQRITLRKGSDTVFTVTSYTDTAVTANRTYGYRLRTHFRNADGELVTDPDTSQGVSVTPKDPSASLALPPDFMDSVKFQFSFQPPDPNRSGKQIGDTLITLHWGWKTGAAGYRVTMVTGSGYKWQLGSNGGALDYMNILRYGTDPAKWSYAKYVGPYASTQATWPQILRLGTYTFCIFAVSPKDPVSKRRFESRPGRLKLDYEVGGGWKVKPVSYGGYDTCPSMPTDF
jgi:hypothetical protein